MKTLFFAVITAIFISISSVPCSEKPKNEMSAKVINPAENIAMNNNANTSTAVPGKVFNISSVTGNTAGKAPEVIWQDNGKTVKFSEFTKGKVVFLNFWGTWCPPCRKEIPDIVKISEELKNKEFVVMGIAWEHRQKEALNNVSKFAANNSIQYINLIANQEIVEAYGGFNSVPTTFIIDKDGNISETLVGMRSKDEFMQSINKLLK